ncbi:MAG: lysozyme family protein [Eubacteriales bacterium]|nr:lysozyme family protein [Eubacteriales bacterium]
MRTHKARTTSFFVKKNRNHPDLPRERSRHRSRQHSSSRPDSRTAKTLAREQQVRHQKVMLVCIALTVIVLLALIFLLPRLFSPIERGELVGVNSDVLSYQPQVEAACQKYGIEEYSVLMLAIMQQESSGQGTDVFQCSESPFNTEYDNTPNSITDVDYSIDVGAQTFAYCLERAGCRHISNMERVKIALQEYNFGNDYALWVLDNYGTYSVENATEFSEMMMNQLGWSSYGDPEYVEHVLRYYNRE